MTARMKTRIRVDWHAARDGEAHATTRRSTRTLCDRPPVPERLAWPETSRCGDCRAELERLEGAPLPQR